MKYLTFLNYGCVEICENMLNSAQQVGISMEDFIIACIDEKSFSYMKKYPNVFFIEKNAPIDYQNFSRDDSTNFIDVIKHKWKIIEEFYLNYKELCYVDCDIVFLKNPTDYISNKSKILFQSDLPGQKLCSGFMIFNNSIDSKNLILRCSSTDIDDQVIVNLVFEDFKESINILPEIDFPNGKKYFDEKISSDPYIVHNNWIIGIDNKIKRLYNI